MPPQEAAAARRAPWVARGTLCVAFPQPFEPLQCPWHLSSSSGILLRAWAAGSPASCASRWARVLAPAPGTGPHWGL